MKSNINEVKRRTEILAAVLNGENLGKADFAFEYGLNEITINRDLGWLRSLGIQINSKKNEVTLFDKPPNQILIKLAADYLPLKLNSDIYLNKLKVYSKGKVDNYFNFIVLSAKAVNEGKYLDIKYCRLTDAQSGNYILKPVRLVTEGLNWILHAFKDNEGILKTFYISRIETLKVLNKKFVKYSEVIDNREAVDIVLRFDPNAAAELYYKIWFEDFNIEKDNEGSLILKTKQPITNKLASWCISWWNIIEVLEPAELKNHIYNMINSFSEKNKI